MQRFITAIAVLFSLMLPSFSRGANPPLEDLFNGKDLTGWKIPDFAGHGAVKVSDGQIEIAAGVSLSGITWASTFPKMNFEIEMDAKKIEGSDFFCAITCPYGDTSFTFVPGGWGGGVVGISSIDGQDASENETTKYREFVNGKWYHFRVRVTPGYIETWIDKEQLASVEVAGRQISLRAGEIFLNEPFGVATYQTTAAVKNIQLRRLPADTRIRKIALIAGKKSHGPGDHEYEKGMLLLKQTLENATNVKDIRCEVHTDGWPDDSASLTNADAIVFYCDGSDHSEKDHPILRADHLAIIGKQMQRGAGFGAIHYAVFVPGKTAGEEYLKWSGGYFDYETGAGENHWFSKIETKDYSVRLASPDHPILRGVKPYSVKEEFYFNLRFPNDSKGWTPLVTFSDDKTDKTSVVGWAIERPDGSRGFGYSGGHFHKNWDNADVRRMMLNALLWIAKAEVPAAGVQW